MRKQRVLEHIIKILELTLRQIQLYHILRPPPIQLLLENLLSEPPREMLSRLLLFETLDRRPIQYFEFLQNVEGVDSVAAVPGEGVPGHVEDYEFLQVFYVADLFCLDYFVVAEVEL